MIHYDESYFNWQKTVGEFGGWADVGKFSNHVKRGDVVMDFGCGGGWLLRQIECAERIGVEINDIARKFAIIKNKIKAFKNVKAVPDSSVDVAISNHALEHCFAPRDEILAIKEKLKPGGKMVFVVPCESVRNSWKPNDINMHIYTWSPMNLGNLFASAGLEVDSVQAVYHKWPPHYKQWANLGRYAFEMACRIYGRLKTDVVQVKIVAGRPMGDVKER